jgi:GDPmannose 4,6-dehydratase
VKTVLVTGIHGQDGVYLTRLLAGAGRRIVGLTRPGHTFEQKESAHLPDAELVDWDMGSQDQLEEILAAKRPTEFYNLAAFSSGAGMFDEPVAIGDINGLAVARILEAIRKTDPRIRFCQASSSEMFGEPVESPQDEETPFNPRSPYGAAKLYAHAMINVYRRRFGLFACSAILFNHESPVRRLDFVTRKITHAAASIKLGLANELSLGNLDAKRDWGFAGDFVRAMWLMLQAPRPGDYVIATGKTHSVRELCDHAFAHVGLDYRDYVRDDPEAFRPAETQQLVGNASKAARELDWTPKTGFRDLVRMMVDADLERLGPRIEVE